MATVAELFDDRREVVDESMSVPYIVTNAADESAVRTACDDTGNIPELRTSLNRTLHLNTVEIESRVNLTTWRVVARYTVYSPDSTYAFDTAGGTQHITQSIATRNTYGPKATTAFKGAIGFDGQNVQGCDITVPVFQFGETHYFSASDITTAYKATLFDLTGKYNNASFKNFNAGEVLFLGASGSRMGDDSNDLWEIRFSFAASPNRQNFSVGDISSVDKLGWDYMWVQYGEDEDAGTSQIIKKPVAVYIEQVYYAGDFSLLDIGT